MLSVLMLIGRLHEESHVDIGKTVYYWVELHIVILLLREKPEGVVLIPSLQQRNSQTFYFLPLPCHVQ